MRDFLPGEVLFIVCCSGYADAARLRVVCLSVSITCREQTPWSLIAARGLPSQLLSWHLRGGDRLLQQHSNSPRADGDGGGGDAGGDAGCCSSDSNWVGHDANTAMITAATCTPSRAQGVTPPR